jgi:protein O-GlcNAc transferase
MNEPSIAEIQKLKTRLNLDPQDYDAAIGLANLYYDANEPAQAIVYYNVALQLRPAAPEAMTDMATMYWQNGDIGLAEKTFRDVIATHPSFGNARLNLGLLLAHGKNDRQNAIAIWKNMVSKLPDHPATQRAKQLLIEMNQ